MGSIGASLLSFAIAIVASGLGTYIYMSWRMRLRSRPLQKILSLDSEEVRFVFAHRDEPSFVLPRCSTEDVLAMNNTISALVLAGYTPAVKIRDPNHLYPADRQSHLFCFCSSKSNEITREVQDKLLAEKLPIFYFSPAPDGARDEYVIRDYPQGGTFPSKSFAEASEYERRGVTADRMLEREFHDLAIITKATNPWNALSKVFIIAGIRGMGTWGAAELLKKNWRQLYERLGRDKRANFSALIAVTYENCDITKTEVIYVRVLDK